MSIWVRVCSLQQYFLSSDCIGDKRLTGILDEDKSYKGKNRGKRNWLWSFERFNANLKC